MKRFRMKGPFRSLYYFICITIFMFAWIRINNIEFEEEIVVTEDLYCSCNSSTSRQKGIWSLPPLGIYKGKVNRTIVIPYDDPKTYEGPVVRGWEPSKDRNISTYLLPQENTIRLDPLACKEIQEESLDLIIVQHSTPENSLERLANRVSWMKFAKSMPEIKLVFLIGIPTVAVDRDDYIDNVLQGKIDKEFEQFGDILQVNVYESYSNLTLKGLHSIKYLLGVDWSKITRSGNAPRFLLKTDDDVFLNLPLIQKTILKNKYWQRIPDDPYWPPMLGHLLPNSQIFRIPLSRIHDRYAPREYYVCPTYFYNGTGNYPSYMQGAGYFLPWWVLQCIYEQSIELPYFFIEDVFFGGFVGERCKLPKYNLDGFHMFLPRKRIQSLDKDIDMVLHYVDKNYKISAFKKFAFDYGLPML